MERAGLRAMREQPAGRDGVRRPSDYHKVLLKRVKALEARLRSEFGEFEARRTWTPAGGGAVAGDCGRTGLDGKEHLPDSPRLGSFGFLAVLLTSLEVKEEKVPAALPDRCGSCTRCLDACPTNALIAPYRMDATKCISYLTIEHRGRLRRN